TVPAGPRALAHPGSADRDSLRGAGGRCGHALGHAPTEGRGQRILEGWHRRAWTPSAVKSSGNYCATSRRVWEFQTHFLPPPTHGKAMRPACFLRIPWSTFFLYTEHLSSILEGNSWYVYPFPAVRGGCYGASGSHLCTSGSSHTVLYHV